MREADLRRFVIPASATIRDAIAAINDNYSEIVIVVDEFQNALGVITDGDVRRGLLRGLSLQDAATGIMTRDFTSVPAGTDRAAALDVMKALVIRQLPILDGARLVGVHLLAEILGAVPKPNRAVIMAGGKGVRLRPYTESRPKPMLPVAGRPILERIVLHLVGHGIRDVSIAINYLGEQIREYFGDGSSFGCKIEYLQEDRELGTAGALSLISSPPDEPVIVMNGDQITRIDFGAMLDFHKTEQASMTMAVGHYQHEIPFGVVEAEGTQLVGMEEKPTIQTMINRGIYVLEPSLLAAVPRDEFFTMVDLVDLCRDRQRRVSVFLADDDWIDVGRPSDLALAQGRGSS